MDRSRTPPRGRQLVRRTSEEKTRNWNAGAVRIRLKASRLREAEEARLASDDAVVPPQTKRVCFTEQQRIKLCDLVPDERGPSTDTWHHLLLGRLLGLEHRVAKFETTPSAPWTAIETDWDSLVIKLEPTDVRADLPDHTASRAEACGEEDDLETALLRKLCKATEFNQKPATLGRKPLDADLGASIAETCSDITPLETPNLTPKCFPQANDVSSVNPKQQNDFEEHGTGSDHSPDTESTGRGPRWADTLDDDPDDTVTPEPSDPKAVLLQIPWPQSPDDWKLVQDTVWRNHPQLPAGWIRTWSKTKDAVCFLRLDDMKSTFDESVIWRDSEPAVAWPPPVTTVAPVEVAKLINTEVEEITGRLYDLLASVDFNRRSCARLPLEINCRKTAIGLVQALLTHFSVPLPLASVGSDVVSYNYDEEKVAAILRDVELLPGNEEFLEEYAEDVCDGDFAAAELLLREEFRDTVVDLCSRSPS